MLILLCLFLAFVVVMSFVIWTVGFGLIMLALGSFMVFGWITGGLMQYKVLSRFGTCSPILGFIPFYGTYLLGKTCNGEGGYNFGFLRMCYPNWFWNYGWASSYVLSFFCSWYVKLFGANPTLSHLCILATQVLMFLYWVNIYTFIYTRMERRDIEDVAVLAVLSALFGVVGFLKVMTIPYQRVYSYPQDVYPVGRPKPDIDF